MEGVTLPKKASLITHLSADLAQIMAYSRWFGVRINGHRGGRHKILVYISFVIRVRTYTKVFLLLFALLSRHFRLILGV